ncbi:ArnT family glycosyltransferase [Arthrobacter dokdonensis]|uniref:ArnT family glycosyltransferase n=1 Tax=Arthrobacter dokdonellae TaxID=2211210 RepID=UPI001D1324CE|nr:glycosyltransferase family 39 protein [Arthrobacter dokdonellae]
MTPSPPMRPSPGGPARIAYSLRAPFAWRPVAVVLAVDAALFLLTVTRYGYHRDELYFRVLSMHPAWGYVDQSPLTPMVVRAGIWVFGDNLWALRVPAMLFALGAVALTALLSAELGGGARAQLLAAAGASSTFVFIAGHILLTASADLLPWLGFILFACRALLRDRPRWWLPAGLVVGLGTYNKWLIALLLLGFLGGLLLAGPRRALTQRWLWAGVLAAVLVGAPNLVYQAATGWPELTMAGALARDKGGDDRLYFVPFQLILLGITLVPIWIAGLVALFRRAEWRPVRAFAWAYPIVALIVLATGGQPYYTFGLLAFAYAAGSAVSVQWARRRALRWSGVWTAVAVAGATAVVVALPVIPAASLPPVIATVNQTARDSVGWPAYVDQVAGVYDALRPAERARTVLLAQNYGEAGALEKFGPTRGLPPVFSGQNQLHAYGPPPATATAAVTVGFDELSNLFTSCTVKARLDNGIGVQNEEQGRAVMVCRGLRAPWTSLWPGMQHYD